MQKKMSQQGQQLLKQFEGEHLNAYQDIAGIWTIGVGHTGKVAGNIICDGMKITAKQSQALLEEDLKTFEKAVNHLVQVPLNQAQFDALVSFVFNIGESQFARSTLLKALNQQNYHKAACELLRWNKVGKVAHKGLTFRRQREKNLFERGQYV